MAKKCTKTPVAERVMGGKLAEKVVRQVGNCKKGGSRHLLVAKKVSQSVVKKWLLLFIGFKRATPQTSFLQLLKWVFMSFLVAKKVP